MENRARVEMLGYNIIKVFNAEGENETFILASEEYAKMLIGKYLNEIPFELQELNNFVFWNKDGSPTIIYNDDKNCNTVDVGEDWGFWNVADTIKELNFKRVA